MKIINEDIFRTEEAKKVYARQGNKVYFKEIQDKRYRLFKKFKNAGKARKFFNKFVFDNGLLNFGKVELSTK